MLTCTGSNGDRWEIYNSSGGWRWRRVATNGRIVGASSESYSSRENCDSNARRNGMNCTPR